MPSLFGKSGSGRAKPGRKSIRGTISGPIPIPSTPADDEFPMRNPVPAKATPTSDEEFPMRKPGTGIATTRPPDEPGASSQDHEVQSGEPGRREQQENQSRDQENEHSTSDSEREQTQEEAQIATPSGPPASTGVSGGSRTDLTRDVQPEPPSSPPPVPPTAPSAPSGSPTSRPASRSPPYRSSPRRSSPPGASPVRVSPPARRATNPALSTIRYSMVSDSPSKQTTQSKDSPLRKKSTLRSALGRLFGRGRKKNSVGNQDVSAGAGHGSGPLGSPHHRSDPTALSRPTQRSPKRSASLPISEFDRPLRSHSIGPDDIMAIESARNSLQADATGPGSSTAGARRRAATTSGRTALRPYLRTHEWGAGLSPRPSSAQGRGSRLGDQAQSHDPNEIGRAITSDSGGGLRRRSRSLSGLQDLAGARSAGRRRSDEIRYWRESYDPGFMSPMSSNAPEDIDDTGAADGSAPVSPAVEKPPKTPPQPFNFGLLSKEMVGMKITHAASMDVRLGNLESRTDALERVVDRLCHSVPGFKGPLDRRVEQSSQKELRPTFTFTTGAPPPIPAVYNPFPVESKDRPGSSRRSLETDTHSQISFGEAPTYIGSLRPPSSPATKTQLSVGAAPAVPVLNRHTSTSTVRGAASMPAMGREAGDAAPRDDVSQLRSELEAERAARQALEAQVKKLSDRLNSLSTTMFAMVRSPSESRSYERLAPSSAGQPSPRLPPPSRGTLLVPRQHQQEQLSVFETDDEEEDDGEASEARPQSNKGQDLSSPTKTDLATEEEGDLTEDDFQTPREDNRPPLTYGAFGEELRPDDDDDEDGNQEDEDDPKRKKAARTLSLSQLTLGRGQRVRI